MLQVRIILICLQRKVSRLRKVITVQHFMSYLIGQVTEPDLIDHLQAVLELRDMHQLTRTGFPAMQDAARTILVNHRAKECDDKCMSIKEIITLIPEE